MSGSPFYVNVTDSRYEMFGSPTIKNKILAKILKQLGGISDTVPSGIYVFRVYLNKRLRPMTSLKLVCTDAGYYKKGRS